MHERLSPGIPEPSRKIMTHIPPIASNPFIKPDTVLINNHPFGPFCTGRDFPDAVKSTVTRSRVAAIILIGSIATHNSTY